MKFNHFFIVVVMAFTAACATRESGQIQLAGAPIDHTKVDEVAKHKLPKVDVLKKLGPASEVQKNDDGTETLVYVSKSQNQKAKDVVGVTLKRDTTVLEETVRVDLDKDGLVRKVTKSQKTVQCSDIRNKVCE
jgi:hypothetical protein